MHHGSPVSKGEPVANIRFGSSSSASASDPLKIGFVL
jgi:hypothetical protein